MGTIFFSYSRQDTEFTLRLAKDLRKTGLETWVDQLDIPAGEHWDWSIEQALEQCEYFLPVLSPDAVSSRNVMDELSFAIEERKRILPILAKNCKLPFRVRRIQYLDFTNIYIDALSSLVNIIGLTEIKQDTPEANVEGETQFRSTEAEDVSQQRLIIFKDVKNKDIGRGFSPTDGQSICDVAEKMGLKIDAECHAGICGSDPIKVLSGMENLNEMKDPEKATIEDICDLDPRECRLACLAIPKGKVVVMIL